MGAGLAWVARSGGRLGGGLGLRGQSGLASKQSKATQTDPKHANPTQTNPKQAKPTQTMPVQPNPKQAKSSQNNPNQATITQISTAQCHC